jgi:hypothetical protein
MVPEPDKTALDPQDRCPWAKKTNLLCVSWTIQERVRDAEFLWNFVDCWAMVLLQSASMLGTTASAQVCTPYRAE